jgi:hypothetical protein
VPKDLISETEAAAILGVSQQRVNQIRPKAAGREPIDIDSWGTRSGGHLVEMSMRRLLVALTVVALALTACGNGTSDLPVKSRLGVRGVVMYGPMCPVAIAGSPCPDRLWSGVVRAIDLNGDTAGETATGDQGTFQLDLPEGTYDVLAVVEGGGPPTAMPVRVTVTGGGYTRVTLQVDSGIR